MRGNRVTAYIGLGSNLGDRAENLRRAVGLLEQAEGVEVGALSSFYDTAPVGYADQPRFLNAAVEIWTVLSPDRLLAVCNGIEQALKRERILRWGPRTIDLDILLYGDRVVRQENLIIPHPRMHQREFVLLPLSEIAGAAVHPVLGQSIGGLYRGLGGAEGGKTAGPGTPPEKHEE